MQQKMILLVAILVVVVVVAAVLLLNKPAATPGGGTQGGGTAGGGTQGGTTGGGTQGGTTGGVSAQGNVICQMSATGTQQGVEVSMTGSIKVEKPDKIRADITGSQGGVSIDIKMIINGDKIYMLYPLFGTSWIETSMTELEAAGTNMTSIDRMMGMSAQEMENEMKAGSANTMMTSGITPTVSCTATGDIPDSEFQLPPGATAKTMAQVQQEMMAASGGGTGV